MFTARISRATTLLRRFATKPEDIGEMIKKNKVVVFMKGVPEEPKCGFSNAVVQIMRMHGVQYDAHDVLKDDSLRQNIKDFSNWPTIPQVFINGEFVGGCDILLQMHQNGELIEELKKVGIDSALLTKEAEKDKEKEASDQAGNPVIETTENNNPNSPEIEKVIDKNQEFQKMTDNNQEILEMIDRRLNKELWALKTKLERAEMRLQENDIKYRALKSEMIEMQGEWLKYKTLQELEILNRNSQSKAIDTQSEALNRIK